ncbi:MAG: hypothetical protein ACPG4K_02055 [Haloferula sp.]
MKRLLLPPFLPLLALLLLLLILAVVTGMGSPGREDVDPLRWVMFLPVAMIWLYPVFAITNLIDGLIQQRFRDRRLSIAVGSVFLAVVNGVLFLKVEGVFGYVFTALCSLAAVASMNWWRNRMVAMMSDHRPQQVEGSEGNGSS